MLEEFGFPTDNVNLERDGNGYAGAAAWMLVDVEESRTGCNVPFDFYARAELQRASGRGPPRLANR